MAETIAAHFNKAGVKTNIKDVTTAKLEDLTGMQDITLLGCPSYGVDDIELQEDFAEYYDQMDGLDLSGRKYAVFAPGDSSHEHFCGAVGKLQDKVKELGGELVVEGLRIDGDPADFEDDIIQWAESVLKS